MSSLKSIDDCASGRDYLEYAQSQGWAIKKNGSYWEIEQNGVMIRFPDKGTCLPKETRSVINGALVKAGLVLVALTCLVCLVAAWGGL